MNTQIRIPGKEVQTIPNMTMSVDDVKAAYAGTVDLSAFESSVVVSGDTTIIEFKNRTGTKGSDAIEALFQALGETLSSQDSVQGVMVVETDEDEEEEVEVVNTAINIPGRNTQLIEGMVLSAEQIISNFSGSIDLNSFANSTEVDGDTQVVTFYQRSGTKG